MIISLHSHVFGETLILDMINAESSVSSVRSSVLIIQKGDWCFLRTYGLYLFLVVVVSRCQENNFNIKFGIPLPSYREYFFNMSLMFYNQCCQQHSKTQ